MEFCPTCGMLLQIQPADSGRKARLCCPTCPYVCTIEKEISRKQPIKKKEADHILTWESEMEGATKGPDQRDLVEACNVFGGIYVRVTKFGASCPQCGHLEAYFYQVQIRSADEPPTSFFKCCNEKCRYNWRED